MFGRLASATKILVLVLLTVGILLTVPATTLSQTSPTINYQGKLTDATGLAVPNGTYNMRFWLIDSPSNATSTADWAEVRTGVNRVQVTNGLFSVMLGEVSSLTGVDFNQVLYLGVEIGGTGGSPTWDGEMSPRKILGTVPAAFEARQLGGVASSSFLRSDQADTATGLLTFTGGLISSASSTITDLTTVTATTTNLVINGERFSNLLGTGLTNNSGVLTVATSTLGLSTAFSNSAQLAALLSDETGTGAAVFGTSPSLTTPVIAGATVSGSVAYNPLHSSAFTITSNLSGGVRSTYPLVITQANDTSNNNTTGLLQLSNSDTASIQPLLNINQTTNGDGISITGITTANAIEADSVTNGTVLSAAAISNGRVIDTGATLTGGTVVYALTSALTSGEVVLGGVSNVMTTGSILRVNNTASAVTSNYSGALIDISPTRTISTASTRNESGNYLRISRNHIVNSGSGSYTTTGALATLSSNCTVTLGTCVDSSNILSLTQSYTAASGSVLNIAGAGTGNLTTLDATNAGANGLSIDLQSSSASQFVLDLTANNGTTNVLRALASGNIGLGTTTPSERLTVVGNARITGALFDSNNASGTPGMVLQSTGIGTNWVATSTLGFSSAFTNSAQLAALLSDETGTGAAVFGTSPTFTTSANFGTAGVRLSDDGDGALTFLGLGNGFDEDLTLNLDDTANTGVFTSSTGLNQLAFTGMTLAAAAGTNALPGYAFNGDTNTGMFSQAADVIGFATGGVEQVSLSSAGLDLRGTTRAILDNGSVLLQSTSSSLYIESSPFTAAGTDSIFISSPGSGPADNNSVIIGKQSGVFGGGSNSNIIGWGAGANSATGLNFSNVFGYEAGRGSSGNFNNYIGSQAGQRNSGDLNDFIGYQTGRYLKSTSTVAVGAQAFFGAGGTSMFTAVNNTALGYRAGYNATNSADNNILIGYQVADNLTTGNNNIIIGYDIDNVTATADNSLNIGNLIFGTGLDGTGTTLASGNIGIGTSTPSQKLTVAGNARITGALFDSNNASGTPGMVLQSTGVGTAWVATSTLGFSSAFSNSAQLAALLSDETGTGNVVFSDSPTFTGTINAASTTLSSTLTMSGSAANINLGTSNFISDDGSDRGFGLTGVATGFFQGTSGTTVRFTVTNTSPSVGAGAFYGFEGGGLAQARIEQQLMSAGNSDLFFSVRGSSTLTERMRLTAAGNLGLGTTTPSERLTVAGNTSITGTTTLRSTAAQTLAVRNASGILTLDVDTTGAQNDGRSNARINYNSFEIVGSGRGVSMGVDDSGVLDGWISVSTTRDFDIRRGGTPMMTFASTTSHVGIGTTTPSERLTVAGNARITGALFDSNNASGTPGMVLQSTGIGTNWVATSTLGFSSAFSNSAQLAALLSDETGTGNVVLSDSPTFTGTINAASTTLSSTLTMSGSAANINLGNLNYVSPDGSDAGLWFSNNTSAKFSASSGSAIQFSINNTSTAVNSSRILNFESGASSAEARIIAQIMSANNSDLIFETRGGSTAERMRLTSAGNLGIGTTTPVARLSLERTGFSTNNGVAALDQWIQTTGTTTAGTQFGNRLDLINGNTATSTVVGSIIRVTDSTVLGNTVRALEVQSNRGTNTAGENTAISGTARTFGIRGITEGDAGGTFEPAGGFFQTRGTTQGNAIRGYSESITSATLLSLFQASSTFTGTGLEMSFGNTTGSFSSTSSRFLDFKNAGTSVFTVSAFGTTTIGDGTNYASLQIGRGGFCVDNDGACDANVAGRMASVSTFAGNSDLAETYFSSQWLAAGEIVTLEGELSVRRAEQGSQAPIIGVVSTKPGVLLGYDDTSLTLGERSYPIALSGRVPIKLSTENGPIRKGDQLMLSSIPGVAMKATSTGTVVGIALENFDENRMYSETYVNQFADDIANESFSPIESVTDPRINDGCYFSGGVDAGAAPCVPLIASSTDGQVQEANTIARAENREQVIRELRAAQSETRTTASGRSVKVGQVVMFVNLRERLFADTQVASLAALFDTAAVTNIGINPSETLFDRLKSLANNFVDGVLSIFELRANRVEVQEEICVDGVCLDADSLRQLLNSQGSPGQGAPTTTDSPPSSPTNPPTENGMGQTPDTQTFPAEPDPPEPIPEVLEPVVEPEASPQEERQPEPAPISPDDTSPTEVGPQV